MNQVTKKVENQSEKVKKVRIDVSKLLKVKGAQFTAVCMRG